MDEDETRARDWLARWHDVAVADGAMATAAAASLNQVRALDAAARRLRLDDEPTRLRTVLAMRARR